MLWHLVGGVALAIACGAIVLIILILSAFAMGSWWSGQLIERGAAIALKAQLSDDRRDIIQVNALTSLVKETLKIRESLPAQNRYPTLSLPSIAPVQGESVFRTSFVIEGLDEEETRS
jgi:hypothetical protein